MTNEPCVWVTNFPNDPRYIFSVHADGLNDDRAFPNKWETGDPLDPANMPEKLILLEKPVPKGDIFAMRAGVMGVSRQFYELLQDFDLGPEPSQETPNPRRVEMHPYPLYEADG